MKLGLRHGAIVALLAMAVPACSDVGDSSAVPCPSGSGDAAAGDDGGAGDATIGEDATSTPDGNVQNPDVTPPGEPDTGGQDVTVPVDAPVTGDDGGAAETGSPDTGGPDSQAPEDSGPDTSVPDAGEPDSSGADASTADSGVDASVAPDAATALVPCTTAGQSGCVQCQGNANGVCNTTEATLVAYDIKKGFATAPGPDPAAGCYTCVLGGLGIDDPGLGVTGEDCDDLTNAGDKDKCIATLSCILQTTCDSSGVISACYCGSAPPAGSCLTGAANGKCDAQEAAGLGFAVSDGSDILKNMTSTTLPSGVANNILVSAASNSCGMCYQ
jgi:hypothetical protein